MRAALFALALLPSVALATITINNPSASQYWVENTTNTIGWSYTQGDPSSVDIVINNQDNKTLNGNYSIARFVAVSQQSVIVTNVTLRVGTGYEVLFVNPLDPTDVYANSPLFEVKAPGTTPAPSSGSSTPSGSSSGSSVSSTGTSTGTATSPSISSSSQKKNSALGIIVDIPGMLCTLSAIIFGTLFL